MKPSFDRLEGKTYLNIILRVKDTNIYLIFGLLCLYPTILA